MLGEIVKDIWELMRNIVKEMKNIYILIVRVGYNVIIICNLQRYIIENLKHNLHLI